jgi:protocatechuate 3,4-dioxygenase beta subunit
VYSHYRTVDVPLLVGYEMGNGKLHTNVNAGAIISAIALAGEILDANGKPVKYYYWRGTNSVYEFRTTLV